MNQSATSCEKNHRELHHAMSQDAYILYDGDIWTVDPDRERVSAMSVKGGRIVATGDLDRVRLESKKGTTEVSLRGRTVTPGLIDAHNHYVDTADMLTWVNLSRLKDDSVEAILERLRLETRSKQSGQWVRAYGLDAEAIGGRASLTREVLDRVSDCHPILIRHVTGHSAVVNTVGLRVAGVDTEAIGNFPSGVGLGIDGRPNGWFDDSALEMVLSVAVFTGNHGPNFHGRVDPASLLNSLRTASGQYFELGITTVADAQVTGREMSIYQNALRSGAPLQRIVCMPLSSQLDDFVRLGVSSGLGDDWLSIGAMKFYSDGALNSGTAAFSGSSDPSCCFTNFHYWSAEDLSAQVVRAAVNGWDIAIHAQGDEGIANAIYAIASARSEARSSEFIARIEHAGFPSPKQILEMADLGIIPVHQPLAIRDFGDVLLTKLPDAIENWQPYRSELEKGIQIVFSSDSPVQHFNPFDGMATAMARQSDSGVSIGVGHAVSFEEALAAYSISAANSLGMAKLIGSIATGKYADILIFDHRLSAGDPNCIAAARPEFTLLDGKIQFSAQL